MTLTTQELNELIYCLGHVAKDKENNMVFRDVALELYIKLNEELEKRVAEEEVKQSKVVSKQTAVEWLVEQLKEFKISKDKWNYDWEDSTYLIYLIEQAKEMEKEQSFTEISDEEIEKIAKEYVLYNESKRNWVVEGMKLYREQLKKKEL